MQNTEFFFRSGALVPSDLRVCTSSSGRSHSVVLRASCGRCGGAGHGPWRQDGGICYRCRGLGVEPPRAHRVFDAATLAKLNARAEAKDAARRAKAQAAQAAEAARIAALSDAFETTHPGLIAWARTKHGDFFASVVDQFHKRGELSPAQIEILARIRAEETERPESAHVGEVGDRMQFDLRIKFVRSFDSQFGIVYINVCEDSNGNIIVYKGSNCLGEKGANVSVIASISEHGEREGVKQTFIKRPKKVKDPVAA